MPPVHCLKYIENLPNSTSPNDVTLILNMSVYLSPASPNDVTLILNRPGSFKTCYVQKHATEIIEVEVWHHILPCYGKDYVKST